MKPFIDGKFNPLSNKEKQVIRLFRHEKTPFYVIAVHKKRDYDSNLQHEIAHALFFISNSYRVKALKIVHLFNTDNFKRELVSMGGYHEDILGDEVQAYAISPSEKMHTKLPKKLQDSLNNLFQEYCRRLKILV